MAWGRLDDQLHQNGKVWSFSDKAFRLWVYSISFCNAKIDRDPEGRLSEDEVRGLCRLAGATTRTVAELVDKRGWDRAVAGYLVHDYPLYGPFRDRTNAERQRRFRAKRRDVTPDAIHENDAPIVTDNDPVTRYGNDPIPIPSPIPHEASSLAEDLRTKETARADGTADAVRAFAVPKPGLAPGSPHLVVQRALAGALNCAEPETTSERRKWAAPIAELVRAHVTAAEVPGLVAAFQEINSVPCTPQGIANQLERLRAPRPVVAANGRHKPNAFDQIDLAVARMKGEL